MRPQTASPVRRILIAATLVSLLVAGQTPAETIEPSTDAQPPNRDYFAYVCAESEDIVYLVRFGPSGFDIVKEIPVGTFPAEIEGPHGINVAPDGRSWYVSVAHGQPFGTIHKFSTGDDEWLGDATVGLFPATLDVSGSTGLLYVVNSDFYGDHTPSTISVVDTRSMTEVAQIDTGAMPHGSRLDAKGRTLYSVNMMDDDLVEVDALRFAVKRRLSLGSGGHSGHGDHSAMSDHSAHQGTGHGPKHGEENGDHAAHASGHGGDHSATDHAAHAGHEPKDDGKMAPHQGMPMKAPTAEPSWVSKPTADGRLYVAALSGNAVIEIDLEQWKVSRRFETPPGPYNVAVHPDSDLLVVTYKKSHKVGFWNLETGEEIAQLETTRRIPHGVVITPDGRFSMVTVEGVGGEPGVVEVFDNRALKRVAALEIGKQAGGIALWEPSTLR